MAIETAKKVKFLEWLLQNSHFSKREVYWLLNYLVSHEVILANVHIVEYVSQTPRGLKIRPNEAGQAPLCLYLNKIQLTDPEQIFHEIRLNWNQRLFLEVDSRTMWQEPLYLAVLEDNPYSSWNEHVQPKIWSEVEAYLLSEQREYEKRALQLEVDEALQANDRQAFVRLSTRLNQLKKEDD